jgi:CheY-like chemotaxis protein
MRLTDLLIVDDDPLIRQLLRRALADDGFSIFEADDGATALTVLRLHPNPLLVLLDVMLPVMSGIELLETLSADPTLAPLLQRHRFIILSATIRHAHARIGPILTAHHIPVLSKPVNLDQLRATAAAAMGPT